MNDINKIVGIGMSKTGTTTLAACLKILSMKPQKSYDKKLKERVLKYGDIEGVLRIAKNYKSFEDSPWYLIFKEMDKRFPNSRFILTIRKDSHSYAKSSWYHGVSAGLQIGDPTDEYINEKIRVYEEHNRSVCEYFKDRPDDLLILCWEKGDGWDKLCQFLGVDVPDLPIPHANSGGYRKRIGIIRKRLKDTSSYMVFLRLRYWFVKNALVQKLKRLILDAILG